MRKSHPGLFEIKIHNLKKRNAIAGIIEKKLTELINDAQENEDIKVILLHGGRFFSSGNDLGGFTDAIKRGDMTDYLKIAEKGVNVVLVDMLLAMSQSRKPIVAVVRGGAIGIGFTMLAHAHFVYCSPEAIFKTPFMESGQSPEGTSTYLFPKIFGPRLANELLLSDKILNSQEAVTSGFVNGIISSFNPQSEWFDPSTIPAIPKLLKNDYRTLTNCMNELILSQNNDKLESVTRREGKALVATWASPGFMKKMQVYLQQTVMKKK